MSTPKVYQVIASALQRIKSIEKRLDAGGLDDDEAKRNEDLLDRIKDALPRYVKERMPSGSGLDAGVKLLDTSTDSRLVFQCDFHHMDENGYYDGWTYHTFVVTPSLQHGHDIKVTGRDRNQIKDYLCDTLGHAVSQEEPTKQWAIEWIMK